MRASYVWRGLCSTRQFRCTDASYHASQLKSHTSNALHIWDNVVLAQGSSILYVQMHERDKGTEGSFQVNPKSTGSFLLKNTSSA